MAACQACGESIADTCGAYASVLVCGDAHADAGTADEYPEVGVARLKLATELVCIFGVVDRFLGAVASDVGVFDPTGGEMLQELCFERIACVIAADNYSFVSHRLISFRYFLL